MGALEEARRLHQLSLAGKFKLNTAEDMGYAQCVGYDTEQINLAAEKQLHVKYANSSIVSGSPTKNVNCNTKKGVYIIKELVCKDLPDNLDEPQEDHFKVSSERKVLTEKRGSKLGHSPSMKGKDSRSAMINSDKLLVYDNKDLERLGQGHDSQGFKSFGGALNKNQSKAVLRPVKILPEIKGGEPEAQTQVNAFSIPVREEIQMTYNTQDGSTIKVRDLRGAPKIQGDCLPTEKEKQQLKKMQQIRDNIRDRDIAKALQMHKHFRKS